MLNFFVRTGLGALAASVSLLTIPTPAATQSFLPHEETTIGHQRLSLNDGWQFRRFTSNPDGLSYETLKPWIMPVANAFIAVPSLHTKHRKSLPESVELAGLSYSDEDWESINILHDWAVKGPFYDGPNPTINAGMGRLPIQGIGWDRRKSDMFPADAQSTIDLDSILRQKTTGMSRSPRSVQFV